MKQLAKLFLLLGLLGSFSSTFAVDVPLSTTNTLPVNCGGGTFPFYKYVGEAWQPYDILHASTDYAWIIKYGSSNITVYNPNNVISVNNGSFFYTSNMKPEGIDSIIAISAVSPFSVTGHGTSPDTPAARLVFSLDRRPTNKYLTGIPATYTYTDLSWNVQTKTYTNKPDWSSAPQQIDNECFDLYTRWCGDGLRTNSEVCDPADTSHAGWGVGGCDNVCQPIDVGGPDIHIKKAAEGKDGQLLDDAAQIVPGAEFHYTYTVSNSGSAPAKRVTITDTFPQYISLTATPTGTDWTCHTGTKVVSGISHTTVICTYGKDLPAGTVAPIVTVPAKVDILTPEGTALRNIAYVCRDGQTSTECNPDCIDSNDPACTPPPPPPDCDDDDSGAQKDPACVLINNFDLRIKKYAKSEDVFAGVSNTEDFNYNVVVENRGTGSVSGVTTVVDTLPSPIVLRATPTGNGWSCTGAAGSASFTCTSTAATAENQVFPVITIPVSISNLPYRAGGYTNTAFVHNPNEVVGKRCFADGHMPTGNETQCTQDTFNADPVTVNPPNPTGYDLRLKKYVNGDDDSTHGITGNPVTYTFVLQNLGVQSSSGVITVTDTDFTGGITIASIAATQGEWVCAQLSGTGFSCTTSHIYAQNEYSTPITVVANLPANMPVGSYRNVACLSNAGDPDESAVFNPNIGQYKNNNCDPALVIIVPPNSTDLMLKKYVADTTSGVPVNDGDHQTATIGSDVNRDVLTTSQSGSLRYRFTVTNLGPLVASGATVVEDTLPNGVSIVSVSGAGWSCSQNGARSFTCTRSDSLTVGNVFPDITVNATTSSTIAAGFYSNVATVSNPGDTNPTNNTDPANIRITVGPACGSIVPALTTDNVTPNTAISYACNAVGFTGSVSNLEYNVACGVGDTTATWTGSNTRVCNAPNSNSASQTVSCGVRDRTNPGVVFTGSFIGSCSATVTTTPGGGCVVNCGGPSHVGKKCVNGVASCATYNSLIGCTNDGIPASLCYSADAIGQATCAAQSMSCGGTSNSGYCGDGVLQVGEECDVRGGSSWCVDCRTKIITTTPGSGSLEMWMTIPTLSRARLGYSWLEGETGRIAFNENRMVLGVSTKAFTLADTVGFGIRKQYLIPLMIEANKTFCLSSTGANMNSNEICTPFGRYASEDPKIGRERICGKDYIILGKGDYQVPTCTLPAIYTGKTANSSNSITLFKGKDSYPAGSSNFLRNAFQGTSIGNSSSLILSNGSRTDIAHFIPLVALDVRVSGAMIAGNAGTVNRGVETYVHAGSLVNLFLSGIATSTTTTATTNTTSTTPVANVDVGSVTASPSIRSLTDLTGYRLNGNQNIFSIKGNVTIESCPNNTFVLDGVRTLIVDGNLTIKCNLVYASNDATSSWAFIVKNGNTLVYPGTSVAADFGVTNLAGVYVNIDGAFRSLENKPSQKILKIDGSMYGDAAPLFDSRLYVRGTNAYEILTTGVVLSYSNRALVNPPPLLSEYLNNYSVTRVVK